MASEGAEAKTPGSAYRAAVADTFPQLTVWGDAVKALPQIEDGSPLAEDAQVFPWLTTADLARQALCGAQDHLKGFRAWSLNDELYPIATFSLLRAALVGGALATWILIPHDSEVRVSRSLVAAQDWYENHLRWGRTMADYALNAAVHADQLRHLENRLDEVRALRSGRIPNWPRLNMTEVIVEANAALWPGEKGRADQTKALWQAGSGDAHALGWAVLSRGNEMTPHGDGMGTVATRPSDKDVADAYLCAYDFVAYGFHRFEELCVAPR
jgi:hypothetical protein